MLAPSCRKPAVCENCGGERQGGARAAAFRVIYYFHNDTLPVFMLNVFAKNEKANLSKAERNALRRYIPVMVAAYRSKK